MASEKKSCRASAKPLTNFSKMQRAIKISAPGQKKTNCKIKTKKASC